MASATTSPVSLAPARLSAARAAPARLSIAAVATYQLLLVALIFIRPELDPSWHTISEWAIGRHGWIMVLAFLVSFGNSAWVRARRALLWTAGLPLLALVGSLVHLALFVVPLGEGAYGPGVPIGWPPRLLLLSYMVWLITVAWQAIRLAKGK